MNITLGNKWNITSDKYQFILREIKIAQEGKNKGKECFGTYHFFPKLEQLCDRLFELELQQSDVRTLEEMLTVVRATRKWIDTAGFTDLEGA